MTVQFANITETRTKMTTLTKRALENGLVILLKNGKPLLGLLDYKEVEGYNKWKAAQKQKAEFEKWADTLPTMEISEDDAKSIAEAKVSEDSGMTLEEFLNR